MLAIAVFALLFVFWYILVDQISSTRVEYRFHANCCNCGSQSNLKLWTLRRDWYFGGIEALEQFFPQPVREAVIPICEACRQRVEANKRRNVIVAVIAAFLLSIPLAILINQLVKKSAFCAGSLSVNFCNSIYWIGGGVLGGIILFLILWELTSVFPGLKLPVRFDLFGKLRFANPDYSKKFKLLNPHPEIPVPQQHIPWGIYLGGVLALCISIISDLGIILTGHRLDPSLQIFPIYYILILEKAGTAFLFSKYMKIAFLLWPVIIASEYLMNPKFNIKDRGEDLLFAAVLLAIFIYESWQTRRDKKLAATRLSL